MERGTVAFFNRSAGKLFGFIKPDAGEPDIFFHFNDNRYFASSEVRTGEKELGFGDVFQRELRYPNRGDRVVFKRGNGKGGKPKACPWNYEKTYERTLPMLGCVTWTRRQPAPSCAADALAQSGVSSLDVVSSRDVDRIADRLAREDPDREKSELCLGCDQPIRDCEC